MAEADPFAGLDAPQQAPAQANPFASLDAPPAPGMLQRAGAAAERIGHAAAEGFGSGPLGLEDFLTPQSMDWLKQHRLITDNGWSPNDILLRGGAQLADLGARGMSGAFKAGQQAILELGKALGAPMLARDIAASPEAFFGEGGMGAMGAAKEATRPAIENLQALRAPMTPLREAPQPPGPMQTLENIAQGKPGNTPTSAPAAAPTSAPTAPVTPEAAAIQEAEEDERAAEAVGPTERAGPVTPPVAAAEAPSKAPEAPIKPQVAPGTPPASRETPAQPVPVTAAPPPRIRTVDQIMREDGLNAKQAAAKQAEEIGAIGKPITQAEMEARRAGVASQGPTQGRQLEPVTNAQGEWIGEKVAEPEAPPQGGGPAGGFAMVKPEDLTTDPERFQFKAANEKGITGALEGVSRWEPSLANLITAYRDTDGKLYVVNGHQRFDLAQRAQAAGQEGIQIPTRIFDAKDGYSPGYMRTLGAYQNIAEGSGTPVDAARIMRAKPEDIGTLKLPELPPRSALVQQGRGLARLSDQSFGMVSNGIVPPEMGAVVGEAIAEPQEQLAALDMIAKTQPANVNQARIMVQDIRNSGFLRGEQTGLFGTEELARSLVPERAKVLDYATRLLRRTKGVFKAAVEGEEALTGAGNKLSRESNVAAQAENARLLEAFQHHATTRGPISDALSSAARELAAGKPIAAIAARFLSDTRRIESRGSAKGVEAGDLSGGAGHEGEGEEGAALELGAPRPPRNVQGQGDIFGQAPAAPAQREPIYTTRNDPRQQMMPGMTRPETAPVMRGRGTQQPADEGLFAKTEQPLQQADLLAAREWTPRNEPKFRDELNDIPHLAGGHEAAADWVFQRGRETGNEHIAIVDNRTGQIVHAGTVGETHRVPLRADGIPDGSFTAHHNHPSSQSLSHQDIAMLAWRPLEYIAAHGSDGRTYIASLGDAVRGWLPSGYKGMVSLAGIMDKETGEFRVRGLYQHALDHARAVALRARDAGMPAHAIDASGADLVNRLLHASRVINYATTAELDPRLERALAQHLEAQGAEYRRAIDLRAEGRTGGLPAPAGERPAEGPLGNPAGNRAGQGQPGVAGQGGLELREGSPSSFSEEPKRRQSEIGEFLTQRMFDVVRDKTGIQALTANIKAGLAPTSLKGAKPMEHGIRAMGADAARSYDQSVAALDAVRGAIDRLSKEDQLDFTDRMERGLPQATPELQKVAETLRQTLDHWKGKVQSLGRGFLAKTIDNYMGHVYANYRQWKAGQPGTDVEFQQMLSAAMSKRPLKGSANFLKRRVFPTQKDAIEAGLVPLTYNPIDLQLLKIREMQKFYHGTRLADEMVRSKMAVYVPLSAYRAAEEAGYRPLDDRTFNPRVRHPEVGGLTEHGKYFAPEPMARVFDRYMSRRLVGNPVYDTLRRAGNALNNTQLGLSGFHAMFIANDTAASDAALGLQQIAGGRLGAGAARALSSALPGVSLVRTLRSGAKLHRAWYDPEGADALWARTARNLATGGGRVHMDTFYRSSASGSFFKHISDLKHPQSVYHQAAQMFRDAGTWGQTFMVPVRLAARALDTMSAPIMEHLVPLAKSGAFAHLAQDWEARHPAASPFERAEAMTQFWDSIENRMGEMTYDNLFWHNALKDSAFLATRSVGWNLGTIRELGGGLTDTAAAVNEMVHLRSPVMTTRMAYTLMMPVQTAILGATLTYLLTGHGPTQMLDYFHPPTGSTDAQGNEERVSIPSYMKDVEAYRTAPIQTLINKASPLIEMADELRTNRDYYGGSIYDPARDPGALQAYADYLLNVARPISMQAMERLASQGASPLAVALAFWGIQPAPASIVSPERGEAWQRRQDMLAYRRRMREPGRMHPFTGGP